MKKDYTTSDENFRYQSETLFAPEKFDIPLVDGTFIVFDLETTGGNPTRNGITEICAIKYANGEIQDTFYTLVNPRIPIPPIVARMTGITNQTVRKAPLIHEVFPAFLEFIGDHILISHNTVGDMTFLVHFAKKVSRHKLTNFFLCTHLLAEKTIHGAPTYSLSGLAAHLNLTNVGKSHRAEADAQMTLLLFLEIKKRLRAQGIELIRDALRYQGHVDTGVRLGLVLDTKNFSKATSGTGVFELYDIHGSMIFAGSSSNVRRDLMSLRQFDALPRRLLRLALQAYDSHVHTTSNLFAALLREAELYAKHKFSYEPVRWHGRTVNVLYVLEERDGSFQFGIGPYPFTTLAVRYVFAIKDIKRTQDKCKELGRILNGKMDKCVLWLEPEKNRLIKILCERRVDEEIEKLRRERFKLGNLLSLAKQRKINAELHDLRALSKLDILEDFTDLSSVNGVLSLSHDEKGERELYPIVQSHVLKPVVCEKGKEKARAAELFARSIQNFRPSLDSSETDVLKTNVMLWMLLIGMKKRHFDCTFYPMLDAKKESSYEK